MIISDADRKRLSFWLPRQRNTTQTLRVFDETLLAEALVAFTEAFTKKSVFAALTRVTVKQYPVDTMETLAEAGFERVMGIGWCIGERRAKGLGVVMQV